MAYRTKKPKAASPVIEGLAPPASHPFRPAAGPLPAPPPPIRFPPPPSFFGGGGNSFPLGEDLFSLPCTAISRTSSRGTEVSSSSTGTTTTTTGQTGLRKGYEQLEAEVEQLKVDIGDREKELDLRDQVIAGLRKDHVAVDLLHTTIKEQATALLEKEKALLKKEEALLQKGKEFAKLKELFERSLKQDWEGVCSKQYEQMTSLSDKVTITLDECEKHTQEFHALRKLAAQDLLNARQENDTLNLTIKDYQKQIVDLNARILHLNSKVEMSQRDSADSFVDQREIARLNEALQAAESNYADLEARLAEEQKNHVEIKDDLKRAYDDHAAITLELKDARKELQLYRESRERLEESVESLESKISRMKSQNEHTTARATEAERNVDLLNRDIADGNADRTGLSNQLTDSRRLVADLKKKLDEARLNTQIQTFDFEQLQESHELLKKDHAQLESERENLARRFSLDSDAFLPSIHEHASQSPSKKRNERANLTEELSSASEGGISDIDQLLVDDSLYEADSASDEGESDNHLNQNSSRPHLPPAHLPENCTQTIVATVFEVHPVSENLTTSKIGSLSIFPPSTIDSAPVTSFVVPELSQIRSHSAFDCWFSTEQRFFRLCSLILSGAWLKTLSQPKIEIVDDASNQVEVPDEEKNADEFKSEEVIDRSAINDVENANSGTTQPIITNSVLMSDQDLLSQWKPTILNYLIHLAVYYLIAIAILTAMDRRVWLHANERTRSVLSGLLAYRAQSNSRTNYGFRTWLSEEWARNVKLGFLTVAEVFTYEQRGYMLPG